MMLLTLKNPLETMKTIQILIIVKNFITKKISETSSSSMTRKNLSERKYYQIPLERENQGKTQRLNLIMKLLKKKNGL